MSLANIKGWQTDLKTGLVVPGSTFEDHNTVENALRYYLAYVIGTQPAGGSIFALDSLFTHDGAPVGGDAGYDGIAHDNAGSINYIFDSSLSVGGDNATPYIEFYGFLDGDDDTLAGTLQLGFSLIISPNEFSHLFASYDINTTVLAGRRFHFYWRIQISGS